MFVLWCFAFVMREKNLFDNILAMCGQKTIPVTLSKEVNSAGTFVITMPDSRVEWKATLYRGTEPFPMMLDNYS